MLIKAKSAGSCLGKTFEDFKGSFFKKRKENPLGRSIRFFTYPWKTFSSKLCSPGSPPACNEIFERPLQQQFLPQEACGWMPVALLGCMHMYTRSFFHAPHLITHRERQLFQSSDCICDRQPNPCFPRCLLLGKSRADFFPS